MSKVDISSEAVERLAQSNGVGPEAMTFDPEEARALVERLTGFTPKRWHLVPDEEGEPAVCIESDGFDICTAWGGYNRADADAALIAAAPDLHAALTAALEENGILRTEKHADAEAIGALLSALTEIRDWRKSCHDYDKDMGHDPREFDVEDLKMMEFRASAAIKGVTNV